MGDGYVPGADWIEWGSGSTGWLYIYQMKGIEANISGLEFDLSYKVNNTTFSVDYSTVIGDDHFRLYLSGTNVIVSYLS